MLIDYEEVCQSSGFKFVILGVICFFFTKSHVRLGMLMCCSRGMCILFMNIYFRAQEVMAMF